MCHEQEGTPKLSCGNERDTTRIRCSGVSGENDHHHATFTALIFRGSTATTSAERKAGIAHACLWR